MSTKQFDTYPAQPNGAWQCSNPLCAIRFADYHKGRCPICAKAGENWSLYAAPPLPADHVPREAATTLEPVGELVDVGDDTHTLICEWTELRYRLPAGTKLYAIPPGYALVATTLLEGLCNYGELAPVEGVLYPQGGHNYLLNEARRLLAAGGKKS